MTTESSCPGFFGKLPSHGDFINRRLSRGFLEKWDEWLQSAVATSKATLADGWLDAYLTSPIWNFVLQSGLCGAKAYAGILMPSVDRVGRYFPLTIAAEIPNGLSPLQVAAAGSDWFDRAGDLAVSSLEDEEFSLEDFDAAVEALGPAILTEAESEFSDVSADFSVDVGFCLPLDRVNGAAGSIAQLADGLIATQWQSYSVWWSDGSDRVAPSLLIYPGIPAAEAFADFLEGQWSAQHWSVIGTAASPELEESVPEAESESE
jgi:type VI secretion system protein ImpM